MLLVISGCMLLGLLHDVAKPSPQSASAASLPALASGSFPLASRRRGAVVPLHGMAPVPSLDDEPTRRFPYVLLPHWAPVPNMAAKCADAVLVAVACLIFFPAFLAMRTVCAISRPLDFVASAFTREYIRWAQRSRGRQRLAKTVRDAGRHSRAVRTLRPTVRGESQAVRFESTHATAHVS